MRTQTSRLLLAPVLASVLFTACKLPMDPPPGADGPTIYDYQNCANCHGAGGEGGSSLGPALRDLGRFWTREQLREFLLDPKGVAETDERLSQLEDDYSGNMTSYSNLSDEAIVVLADWLLTL